MKIFIVVLSFLALSLTSPGSARPYLQTLIKEHGLAKMAATPLWRRYFPAGQEIPPSLNDFINETLGSEGLKELKGEELAQHMEESRDQWFKEFYPEPTEEKVLQVLGEDAELRALITAFLIAYNTVQQRGLRYTCATDFSAKFWDCYVHQSYRPRGHGRPGAAEQSQRLYRKQHDGICLHR